MYSQYKTNYMLLSNENNINNFYNNNKKLTIDEINDSIKNIDKEINNLKKKEKELQHQKEEYKDLLKYKHLDEFGDFLSINKVAFKKPDSCQYYYTQGTNISQHYYPLVISGVNQNMFKNISIKKDGSEIFLKKKINTNNIYITDIEQPKNNQQKTVYSYIKEKIKPYLPIEVYLSSVDERLYGICYENYYMFKCYSRDLSNISFSIENNILVANLLYYCLDNNNNNNN